MRALPIMLALGLAAGACVERATAPSHSAMDGPPIVMALAGVTASGGGTVITAKLDVRRDLDGPVTLRIDVPEHARLLDGPRERTLERARRGTQRTRWRTSALHGESVEVVAIHRVGDVVAARTSARFPAARPAPTPRWRPVPSTRAGGIPIREAVPLSTKDLQ